MTYKSFIKGALVVLVALTMSGCFVNLITQEYKDSLLEDEKQWYVYKFTLKDGQEFEPIWKEAQSTMSFDTEENRIFGVSVCNNYFATFALRGKKLKVSASGASRRLYHPSESSRYEFWFVRSLEGEFVIEKEGKEMRLKGEHATYYLRR